MSPNLDLPEWSPLIVIALLSACATILTNGPWSRFAIASTAGTVAGLWGASAIWPSNDSEAEGLVPIVITVAAALVVVVWLIVGLVVHKLSSRNVHWRRFAWIALGLCVLIGPIGVVLTPPLTARRVARNDQLAAHRFASLKDAAERAAMENGGPDRICDGTALKQNYTGPAFSESDWRFIEGNYVRVDGYMFGIWCHQQGGYTIDVVPARGKADGTKSFCVDESSHVGCGTRWVPYRAACAPCG